MDPDPVVLHVESLVPTKDKLLMFIIALVSAGAVIFSLGSEHLYGLDPSGWAVMQRIYCLLIALLAIPAFLLIEHRYSLFNKAMLLILVLSVLGLVAVFAQDHPPYNGALCDITLADQIMGQLRLEELWPFFFGIYSDCHAAPIKFYGVNYEFYSAGMFFVLMLLSAYSMYLYICPKKVEIKKPVLSEEISHAHRGIPEKYL